MLLDSFFYLESTLIIQIMYVSKCDYYNILNWGLLVLFVWQPGKPHTKGLKGLVFRASLVFHKLAGSRNKGGGPGGCQ